METLPHLMLAEMEAQLDTIRQSPSDRGIVEMIVCRPEVETRQVLDEAELDPEVGLRGDNWLERGDHRGGPANPESQINLMNSRVVAILARERERWPLAGDQFYVDFDLSEVNVPPGTRLQIGSALLEVTAEPHTGCHKFAARFGPDATRFVNTPEGKRLHLRGINAKVIERGTVRPGDPIEKKA